MGGGGALRHATGGTAALVLWRWNTLLIVLEALGLNRHCQQKCDIRAISDERLHSSSLKNWP